ncbi:peptide chain release factor N(5)-glutamine methyltransferase [Candidatus Peregrinibacteria bacterium]|nr:peptide chain release factor N(5)-glutamine methyltransferase [Candidatus Peregrinibacteria bacterium]
MQIKNLRKSEIIKDLGQNELLAIDPLLEHLTGKQREYLFAHPEYEIEDDILSQFFEQINCLKDGKPLSQIINKKEFFGLEFYVSSDVLTPRPESELIVELVLNFIKKNQITNPKILDIGTGSGNLVLSIMSQLQNGIGIGLEISDEALKVAKKNQKKLQLNDRVKIKKSDLLNSLENNEAFDVLVANLPYIGLKKFNFVSNSAFRHEPHIALFGGEDGLDLYRRLFEQIKQKNIVFKIFMAEFGFGQEDLMRKLIETYYQDYRIINDLAGIPRIFIIEQ